MRTVSVGTLVTRIRQRADVENFANPSDSEIKGLISAAYSFLRDILTRSGLAYFESTLDWTSDGLTAERALPADFYGVLRVDEVQSTRLRELKAIDIREVGDYDFTGELAVAFRVVGVGAVGKVVLYPRPPSGQSYRLTYTMAAEDLSAAIDAVTIDGIDGWEEAVVVLVALKLMSKENQRRPDLERQLDMELGRVEENRTNRELLKTGQIRQSPGDGYLPNEPRWWYAHPYWTEF